MCALRALRRSRRHYTPSPLIVPGYGGGSVAALWKYRSMLDWTDIGKEGAFHTLSEVAARRAL